MPKPRPIFPNHIPSRKVTARKFPAEFSWWRASGWQMVVEDAADGGLHLSSQKGNTSWGASATQEAAATAGGVKHFLAQALYLHCHPIKSRRVAETTGQVCTEVELAAFIRGQQRKVAKAG